MVSPASSEPAHKPAAALEDLLGRANPRSYEDQRILLMGLADLYEDKARAKPVAVTEVFIRLVREAENTIRQLLAERMAQADWAPRELVQMLAHDRIEIARSLILSSPLLDDEDLLELLHEASLEHQVQVAQRPGLGQTPVKYILEQAAPSVVVALANNPTAEVDGCDMERMLNLSREITALKSPLTRHPALSEVLALKLFPWVGQNLRQEIVKRFTLDASILTEATVSAVHQAQGLAIAADQETAERLVQKLHRADQLRPAYLIRAAREGRLPLFAHGLAALGEFPIDQVYRALNASSARPLFLACTAVGVDRAAFGSLLTTVQNLNRGLPRDPDAMNRSLKARSRGQADQEFRTLMNDLSTRSN